MMFNQNYKLLTILGFSALTLSFWYITPIYHNFSNMTRTPSPFIKIKPTERDSIKMETLEKNILEAPILDKPPMDEIELYLPKRDYSAIDEQMEDKIYRET